MLNRILRRLAGPDHEVKDLARAVKKLSDAQRDHSASVLARLGQLDDLIALRSTGKDANEILHALRATTALVAKRLPAGHGAARSEARLHKSQDAVAKGNRPINVGPRAGGVGFEFL